MSDFDIEMAGQVLRPIRRAPRYYVSTDGRVYDHNLKEVQYKRNASGERVVSLLVGHTRLTGSVVYRLVLEAFRPTYDPGTYYVRRDGDKNNDAVNNFQDAFSASRRVAKWRNRDGKVVVNR